MFDQQNQEMIETPALELEQTYTYTRALGDCLRERRGLLVLWQVFMVLVAGAMAYNAEPLKDIGMLAIIMEVGAIAWVLASTVTRRRKGRRNRRVAMLHHATTDLEALGAKPSTWRDHTRVRIRIALRENKRHVLGVLLLSPVLGALVPLSGGAASEGLLLGFVVGSFLMTAVLFMTAIEVVFPRADARPEIEAELRLERKRLVTDDVSGAVSLSTGEGSSVSGGLTQTQEQGGLTATD